ncbi:MAG TPA: hypothetical protein VF796_23680 [Humisphaera sp.]
MRPARFRVDERRAFVPVLLAVVCCVAHLPASAAPKPPAKAATEAAVEDLRREFLAYQKDPTANPLRRACDYFAAKPDPAVTVDAVLAAVDQRIDADARLAAYVRWQLLSGLPREVPAADASRAIEVYRRAPAPGPRFGLSEREQQALDAMIPSVKKTDDVILTSRLEAQVKVWSEQNRHLIAYRDEWYRRLPKTAATFAAAFDDAFARQNLAAGADDFAPLVIADAQQWLVIADPPPAECAALAGLLGRLRDKPAPPYYASAAVRQGKLTWVKKTDSMDPRKKLTHLHQALVEAAQKPPKKPKP